MVFRFRSIAITAFFAFAIGTGWARFALADSNLWTRPLAPWMTLDEELTEKRPPVPGKQAVRIRTMEKRAAGARAPNIPVITPEDTLELIKQIYEDDPEKLSPLEEIYSRRIVDELRQFGYDLFGTKSDEQKKAGENQEKFPLLAGAAQDSFLLNMGDTLTITFRGQRQDSKTYAIDSEGRLIVDEMYPVTAAGRTIGDLRAELAAQAGKLHNTEIFVSLESVRQANVLIVGHVNRPGRQTLTVFHTVLDALMEAGGVQKTGSLRQIKLIRDGRTTIVDLYALLIHGSAIMDISLRDGDRIVVPPTGPTVAVAGGVKRPGIYEILPVLKGFSDRPHEKSQQLALQDMLDMAGGILTPGQNRFIRMNLTSDGREKIEETSDALAPAFRDGDILMVALSSEARSDTVELQGHSRRNGIHALDRAPTLSALLNDKKVFGPDIYPLIGIIERKDEDQMARKLIAFPPLLVLKEKFDRRLQDGDVVHLFSRAQIDALDKRGKEKPAAAEISGSAPGMADEDAIDDPVIIDFLRERSVFVRGAVRDEGAWPVAEDGISLENAIAAAGGMTLEAATSNVEVTSKLTGEGH
ncbi:MAG: SLBB domain-containing protein, partial [Proteobacteria bacterium]|nr:SLBB domain-containing protein [Pseudomonadota bacterium]